MAKAPKKPKAKAEEANTETRSRTPSAENQERLDIMLARIKEEPGILSRDLAAELGITTMQCSQLGDRLVKQEKIGVFKLANGQRANYLPGVLKKKLPSLEKARDAEIAAREAKKSEPKAPKTPKAGKTDKTAKTAKTSKARSSKKSASSEEAVAA